MPEKTASSAYSHERQSGVPSSSSSYSPFEHAHLELGAWVETASISRSIGSSSSSSPTSADSGSQHWHHQRDRGGRQGGQPSGGALSEIVSPSDSSNGTWLPDIYRYSSVGLGLGDRYQVPFPQPPTPFVPSLPRVAETKDFNFDYGDLTVGLVEETSYMAWF